MSGRHGAPMIAESPMADAGPVRRPHDAPRAGTSSPGGGAGAAGESGRPDSASDGPSPVVAHSSRPERIRILLLAANPLDTGRLAIDEEAREITRRLRLARDRDAFELITGWAAQPSDLFEYVDQYRPHIVHFSGHGLRAGEILLSAGGGARHPVGVAALDEFFRVMRDDIRVVLLNACHTAAQAQAIGRHIDFVVGTRAPILDEAATVFAAEFYSALGYGRPIPRAFEQARAALLMHGLVGRDVPELVSRPGADPYLFSPEPPTQRRAMTPPADPAGQAPPPAPAPPPASTSLTAKHGSTIVTGTGNVVTTGGPSRRSTLDTKVLLGLLAADGALFLYGMTSYTGQNTGTEIWRAAIFLTMMTVTASMIRRWLRRRM